MKAPPRFYRHSVTGTATKSRCILSNDLPCLRPFKDRPEADQLLNRWRLYWIFPYNVRKPKTHLCMSIRFACSKLARQRLMRQGGSRVKRYERPALFLSRHSPLQTPRRVSIESQSLVQPQQADESCPLICHASTHPRLGQRQISGLMVQDFVEYFCSMSGSRRISAGVLKWSTHTSIGTHVASWPSRVGPESSVMNGPPRFYRHSVAGTATKSRCIFAWGTRVASWPSGGLCDKVGPESHIMKALPRFYRDSVAGAATKSKWILSKYCHASALSRLGQRQISWWIVQDLWNIFVPCQTKNLCMSLSKHASVTNRM